MVGDMQRTYPTKNGFTLIELSIVLVIIGLTVGGIVVGKELIKGAEMRRLVSTVQSYQTAINTFKLKYGCLPGDCTNAVSTLGASQNGNGNGIINRNHTNLSQSFTSCHSSETISAHEHLARAGLIGLVPFTSTTLTNCQPKIAWLDPTGKNATETATGYNAGNGIFVVDVGGQMAVRIGGARFHNGVNLVRLSTSMLTPLEARAIDAKLDDGKPRSGRVWNQLNWPSLEMRDFSNTYGQGSEVDCQVQNGTEWNYIARDSHITEGTYCALMITPSF